ncbi:MAG: hypothetical protein FVQ85_02395 [Planctomycetes bacterium]|nr:hypothetical protein [Planctomycetota bacterium]
MLSFLRDQGFDESAEQGTTKSSNDEANKRRGLKSPSRTAGNAKEQQYLTVAAQGKNVRKMTMLLTVLFVIGLLCLLFMIKKSVPRTAAATSANTEEAKIVEIIARLTGAGSEMFKRMDHIVKKFYEFSDVRQVRVNELVKNPFERQIFLDDGGESSDSKNAEWIRKQRLRERKKGLQLFAICQTDDGNYCMIDDKILYEGDTIKDFKVSQISDAFVKLELEDVEIVLKLSQ